jgi:hypothetical protein
MRVRDHVAVSTVGAVLLRRLFSSGGIGFWAGGVLIDADHYLWYVATQRRLGPVSAVRFFSQAAAPEHSATRVLHSPGALLLVTLLAARTRRLRSIAAGMCLHAALDAAHRTRMDAARDAALARDSGRCQACGTSTGQIRAHLARQPLVGPSYRLENLVSLCPPCHEAAHTPGDLMDRRRVGLPVREEESPTWTF